MIQWIAASLAGKDMTYCFIGNKVVNIKIPAIYKDCRIEEVYQTVVNASFNMKKSHYKQSFFTCL